VIGSGLEDADLESRVASWAASVIGHGAAAACGDRGRWRPAGGVRCGRRRQPVTPATQYVDQQMSEQAGGGCSAIQRIRHRDSGTFRIRLRSPSTTRLRLGRRRPARTGAVQVDVGLAGAARGPAPGAIPGLEVGGWYPAYFSHLRRAAITGNAKQTRRTQGHTNGCSAEPTCAKGPDHGLTILNGGSYRRG